MPARFISGLHQQIFQDRHLPIITNYAATFPFDRCTGAQSSLLGGVDYRLVALHVTDTLFLA